MFRRLLQVIWRCKCRGARSKAKTRLYGVFKTRSPQLEALNSSSNHCFTCS
ncbi:hypothetical protein QWZ13_17880 [Reinekea marina]|uniref:hypothetical protein n=1 Tax=Reinekea marina TaxID=1310421 RepID=UPI0025B502C7|nr:hypothetical protein [Reinekea marina]MDN3650780.1 hypothetical protein [Reinekea marina]